MKYILPSEDQKCILVTSSMSGEGKSFVTINLASALALSGRRVVLIEMDLRKPQISNMLGISNSIGISNYAIKKVSLDQILKPCDFNKNLWVIPSGPIPPNPSELLMMPKINELFDLLKEQFDYIVIDTAPIGLVTDAQLIAKYADASLFVVRQRYTYKQQLTAVEDYYRDRRLPNLSLVINDVKYRTGSGYHSGYGYGSYADQEYYTGKKRKWHERIKG
jgi:capsular exopolysaccharide synthesis family protein